MGYAPDGKYWLQSRLKSVARIYCSDDDIKLWILNISQFNTGTLLSFWCMILEDVLANLVHEFSWLMTDDFIFKIFLRCISSTVLIGTRGNTRIEIYTGMALPIKQLRTTELCECDCDAAVCCVLRSVCGRRERRKKRRRTLWFFSRLLLSFFRWSDCQLRK